MTDKTIDREGELALAISNAIVRILASTTGRGPTKAKTTFGSNAVFVVLQDTLTKGERNLVDAARAKLCSGCDGSGRRS